MNCRVWQELLQRQLDGLCPAEELDRHCQSCPDCARQLPAIRRLTAGLVLLRSPLPPADLADRILTQLEPAPPARPRLGRRLPYVALACAAAVLFAITLYAFRPAPAPDAQPGQALANTAQHQAVETPAISLRDSMAEGATAVALLTTKAAEQTTSLLPPVPPLETLTTAPSPVDPPLEPLREATSGVTIGLAPVTDSARRAVQLFLRDLPMGRSPDDKNPG